MADETAEAPVDETPSDDDAPVDDDAETPSEETDEEPAEEPADEPEEEGDGAPPEGDPALVNLEKKFAHIKDPDQRRVAVAKAYWDKTNYASRVRRENDRLARRVADYEAREKAAKEKPEEPPPPDPDLQELDQRITALVDDDKRYYAEGEKELETLNEVDTEIAKLQGKAEDAKEAGDDQKHSILESRIEARQAKREAILRRYRDIQDRRKGIRYDHDRLTRDRVWLAKTIEDRAHRQENEKRELAEFKADFPEKVDGLIEAAAGRLGIPAHLTEELLEEVNDGLLVDLWRLGEADLDDVDVPGLVKARVEKFARARDLVQRQRFKDKSSAKLKVTSPASRPGTAPAPRKAPVSPASMTGTSLGPKMKAAREYLVGKGY